MHFHSAVQFKSGFMVQSLFMFQICVNMAATIAPPPPFIYDRLPQKCRLSHKHTHCCTGAVKNKQVIYNLIYYWHWYILIFVVYLEYIAFTPSEEGEGGHQRGFLTQLHLLNEGEKQKVFPNGFLSGYRGKSHCRFRLVFSSLIAFQLRDSK